MRGSYYSVSIEYGKMYKSLMTGNINENNKYISVRFLISRETDESEVIMTYKDFTSYSKVMCVRKW